MSLAADMTDTARREQIDELQSNLSLVFARARAFWKEAAQRIHPDLHPTGYKLLSYIARSGGAKAHQLVELFETDKSVISRQVRMLEELGLVDSRPDERDGRLRVLTATEKARTALAASAGEYEMRINEAIGGLTDAELSAASKVFKRLAEA